VARMVITDMSLIGNGDALFPDAYPQTFNNNQRKQQSENK
jgi:hypothetical protein